MKYLDPVTLVNSPGEIYQLFTEIFPEMVPDVKIWFPLLDFSEESRYIEIYLKDEMRLRFGVRREAEGNIWRCAPVYMIPAYITDVIPSDRLYDMPAEGAETVQSMEEMTEYFCRLFPLFRDRVIGQNPWLDFGDRIRAVRIQLYDRKQILFKMMNLSGQWDVSYPLLVPRPDDEIAPPGEIDELINSQFIVVME